MKDIYIDDNARTTLLKYIKEFMGDPKNKQGIYLNGSFGSGKSYIMNAVLNELSRKNYKCVSVYYPNLLKRLKDSFNSKNESFEQMYNELEMCDVLLIDDIGAENNTPWARDEGGKRSARLAYEFDYALEYLHQTQGWHACALRYPIELMIPHDGGWFRFLDDIMPAGSARRYWVRQLDIGHLGEEGQDRTLLALGTIAPIGNLRIKEAVERVAVQIPEQSQVTQLRFPVAMVNSPTMPLRQSRRPWLMLQDNIKRNSLCRH
jgi:hypothetical protein